MLPHLQQPGGALREPALGFMRWHFVSLPSGACQSGPFPHTLQHILRGQAIPCFYTHTLQRIHSRHALLLQVCQRHQLQPHAGGMARQAGRKQVRQARGCCFVHWCSLTACQRVVLYQH